MGGYIVQLGSLPAMALVSGWELAVLFLFFERLGRAIRKPPLEAMDQIGAFLGPAIFSSFLFLGPQRQELGAYREGLLWLFVPAALAIGTVVTARFWFPHPERFELPSKTPHLAGQGFPKVY